MHAKRRRVPYLCYRGAIGDRDGRWNERAPRYPVQQQSTQWLFASGYDKQRRHAATEQFRPAKHSNRRTACYAGEQHAHIGSSQYAASDSTH